MKDTYAYKLSVIIVNYNVQYFLDQCLESVKKASKNLPIEIIIVDNNSVDGSIEMLQEKHNDCTLIINKDNVGFSKANNQAIHLSKGEYVVLLNPDTVVAEDTFEKTVAFMDVHSDAGGLGVHMVDGKGGFLPESKRGLPRPMVAFYKIFGLSNLFPKSKRFSQYHLGNLPENETNEIDILSGAFMLMRKTALDKVGVLDENFFMYGEDIDLSYRIQLSGYKNYYFADTSIIHYKGESTKKSSVNYVFVFYNAMIIFAQKHFSGKQAKLFSFLINLAIYLRAFLAICIRFIKRIFIPLIDFAYVVIGLYALTNYWKMSAIEFPQELIKYSIPIYAATWLASTFFNGGYDAPVRLFKFLKGVFLGTLLILLAYAVLPKSWQFSRLFIFIGAGWVISYYLISRVFLHFAMPKKFNLRAQKAKSFAIIGGDIEFERVSTLLSQTSDQQKHIQKLSIEEVLNQTNESINEYIFCSKDVVYERIIQCMVQLKNDKVDFKIAPADSNLLIGSNSIDTAGELYMLNLNTLISKENKRKKRLFDFVCSLGLILSFPLNFFLVKNKSTYFVNLINILLGKISFIGFSDEDVKKDVRLPKIKSGILSPAGIIAGDDVAIREKLNLLYSRDYSIRKDLSILLKSWGKLGE
ncbi:MAG: glycosyltransferase [Crocinitomicaceae bacterium]|nr:glycosyltransferase [Crocinitomicaceae bacterium]